jgi:hypothetical protein
VFLNGGLSPFALPRGQGYAAEAVPGQPLAGNTYEPILDRLPIAVIGVPWYQVAHLPDLPVVAHETGHAVEHDFGLSATIASRITDALAGTGGAARTAHWRAWASEIFADAWGCRALGPAYTSALADFLAEGVNDIQAEVATENGKYPTATLRMLLCARILDTHFPEEAEECRHRWTAQYPLHAMAAYEADVAPIASAVYLAGSWSETLEFVEADWLAARHACDEIKDGKPPESATSAARLVAAARRLYDEDPQEYAAKNRAAALLQQAGALVQPGTRAGERVLTGEEKDALTARSTRAGIAAFDDFRKWADGDRGLVWYLGRGA